MIREYCRRIGMLILGLVVSAVGIVMMLQANVGLEPWSVLQEGLSLIHISFTQGGVNKTATIVRNQPSASAAISAIVKSSVYPSNAEAVLPLSLIHI